MSALTAAFLFQIGQGITVETDTPDAHCPDLHQTREAVNARLGTIQDRGYRARYSIVHARGEIPRDFVLLEVSSPDGEIHLRRELPIGDSCAAVADAIALVLDQYFRALLSPEETLPETAAAQAVDEPDPRERREASVEPSRPSWSAMLEFAAVSFPSSVAAGLRLQAELSTSWHAGLELAMPLSDRVETLPDGGEARARSFELGAHLGWGPDLGAVRPYLGPTLFTMLERGYSTSPLTSATQYRLLVGAGGELGLNVGVAKHWRTVAFASGGRIFAQSADFVVGNEQVLSGIGWVGKVGLGFAYTF
jgi:hypothetical protein